MYERNERNSRAVTMEKKKFELVVLRGEARKMIARLSSSAAPSNTIAEAFVEWEVHKTTTHTHQRSVYFRLFFFRSLS